MIEFVWVIQMAVYSRENSCFFEHKIYKEPMTMPRMHFHDTHELYVLKKGRTKYFVGNEIFLLEPEDMVFIPKFVFHRTDNEGSSYVERLRFAFDDAFVGEEYEKYIQQLSNGRFIRIPRENRKVLQELFNRIADEERQKQVGCLEIQQLCLRQLLILISRYRTNAGFVSSEPFTVIQSIAKYISESCDSDLSLAALSKKYAMSGGHLSRLFKSVTGVGLSEYINIARITAAEKMLCDTDMPITQIAVSCGFNDSSYFAAVFKRLKGTTPKKFSSKMRQK